MNESRTTRAASLRKRVSPGLQVVTLRRAMGEEIFIAATPQPGEPLESVLAKVAEVLEQHQATPVSQEVFGLSNHNGGGKALEAAFKDVTWPITWIESGYRSRIAGTLMWAVSGMSVEPVKVEDRIVGSVFEDEWVRYCRLGGLMPQDGSRSRPDQAREVLDLIETGARTVGMEFSDVVRTWFCNDNILEWYGEFNQVRDQFFRERSIFDKLVPASTGVGGRNVSGNALAAGALAIQAKPGSEDAYQAYAVPSPLQCPALEYGSSFSRATQVDLPDVSRLYVSGTASIAPEGHTVHLDDVDAQLDLTMRVAGAILESRGMSWADATRAIAYYKHAKDAPTFQRFCREKHLPTMPCVVVYDDICRDDLLFEIEIDTIIPR